MRGNRKLLGTSILTGCGEKRVLPVSMLVGPGVEVNLVKKGRSLCQVWLSWSGWQKVAEVMVQREFSVFLVLGQGLSC